MLGRCNEYTSYFKCIVAVLIKDIKIYLAYKLFVLVYLDIFFPYTHEHVVSPGIAPHTCLSKQGEHVSPLMNM